MYTILSRSTDRSSKANLRWTRGLGEEVVRHQRRTVELLLGKGLNQTVYAFAIHFVAKVVHDLLFKRSTIDWFQMARNGYEASCYNR